jgi:c-di-GMP-binding flagellar brake protein YcgR
MSFLRLFNLGKAQNFNKIINEERRKHPRASVFNLVRYIPKGNALKEEISNLMNLSEGGLQFFSKHEIEAGTILGMQIHMAAGKEIHLAGKVVWVRHDESGKNGYQIGVSFMEMDDKHRAFILSILKAKGMSPP